MPSTEIAVPFQIGGDGRVVTVSDPDAQVRQHVRALINTRPYERAMVPGYGTPLDDTLFENVEDLLMNFVSTLVTDAMAAWEPGVSLISVNEDPQTDDSMAILDVKYARQDAPDSGLVANANEAIISADGSVKEIVRG